MQQQALNLYVKEMELAMASDAPTENAKQLYKNIEKLLGTPLWWRDDGRLHMSFESDDSLFVWSRKERQRLAGKHVVPLAQDFAPHVGSRCFWLYSYSNSFRCARQRAHKLSRTLCNSVSTGIWWPQF
jgi:hypothetical protein